MPGFLSDAELTERADAIFRAAGGSVPKEWRTKAVADANAQAWDAIAGTLGGRGFTVAQILTWQAGKGFQADVALFLVATRARLDLDNEDLQAMVPMDRRKELETLFPTTADGSLIQPPTNKPLASVSYGRMKPGTTETFRNPDGSWKKW